jgi:ABC-2 type transport system ATP-binding protein
MKQRLGIAHALIHKPELIILDEPTSGLDPQGMKDVRELIRGLGKQGTTVFLSSHLLHEIEQVCNRAVIINKGRVIVEGTVDELRPTGTAVKVLTRDQARATTVLRAQFGESNVMIDEKYLIVDGVDGGVPDLIRTLVAAELDIEAVVPAPEQGLEDYFLELTQSADVDTDYAGAAHGGAQ